MIFLLQNGILFYWHIYENMQQVNNKVDNFEAMYCTLSLLCIEMGGDEVLMELFKLALGIQVGNEGLPSHFCLMSQFKHVPHPFN